MIIEFEFKNYKSFKNETLFSMEATNINDKNSNIYQNDFGEEIDINFIDDDDIVGYINKNDPDAEKTLDQWRDERD
jgi:hypothetical protein